MLTSESRGFATHLCPKYYELFPAIGYFKSRCVPVGPQAALPMAAPDVFANNPLLQRVTFDNLIFEYYLVLLLYQVVNSCLQVRELMDEEILRDTEIFFT
jgi:hypothetical protein